MMPSLKERYDKAKQHYHKTGEQLRKSKGLARVEKEKKYKIAKQKYHDLGKKLRGSK